MKILLAVDGSEAGLAAVEEAARTPWPAGSVVRIVSVAEIPLLTPTWMMPMPIGNYKEWERIFEERPSRKRRRRWRDSARSPARELK